MASFARVLLSGKPTTVFGGGARSRVYVYVYVYGGFDMLVRGSDERGDAPRQNIGGRVKTLDQAP